MQHILFNKKSFDSKNNFSNANRKIAHIYEVTAQQDGEPRKIYTMGMFEGNKTSVIGAESMGVGAKRVTRDKLTYSQISWLDLGRTADEILSNLKQIDEKDLKDRLKIALS
jgi:hypothetical protein